ncbi:MAG: hypothetical protein IJQ81_03695 [Oscillibacter sp.]|nr:hypothetical protein [Oscillibacter sp.]
MWNGFDFRQPIGAIGRERGQALDAWFSVRTELPKLPNGQRRWRDCQDKIKDKLQVILNGLG